MSPIIHRGVALAALIALLGFGMPVMAQTNGPPPPPPAIAGDNHGEWSNDVFQHQEFREEMAQIRKEHEELETDRDKLLDKCVNVSGAKVDACNREREEIHERAARLHDRTHALHEKMRAAEAHDGGPPPKPPGQ